MTKVALGVGFRAKRKSALEATNFFCELNGFSDGSDEVLSSLSSAVSYFAGYLYCKLNGKRVSDQRSKC